MNSLMTGEIQNKLKNIKLLSYIHPELACLYLNVHLTFVFNINSSFILLALQKGISFPLFSSKKDRQLWHQK